MNPTYLSGLAATAVHVMAAGAAILIPAAVFSRRLDETEARDQATQDDHGATPEDMDRRIGGAA